MYFFLFKIISSMRLNTFTNKIASIWIKKAQLFARFSIHRLVFGKIVKT